MKILITHAYTKNNKGDAAILSVLLNQLKTTFINSQIHISTFDDIDANKTFEGFKNTKSFFYLIFFKYKNTFLKAIFATYILTFTLIWAYIYRIFKIKAQFLLTNNLKQIINEYLGSDLIVAIGGGYINSKPDTINLLIVLQPIALAVILKKTVILYSQSIGPFKSKFQKFITAFVLNRTNLIMAREDKTIKTLKEIGLKKEMVLRTVDAAFLFKDKKISDIYNFIIREKQKGKIIVGLTVREWLKEHEQQKYETEFAGFLDRMARFGKYLFIFIPQVSSPLHKDDDRIVAERIVKKLKYPDPVINLAGQYSHQQIKAIYDELDFIIGTRFHSVIFSLTSYVPALAIEYEYKTSGIMKDLGLSEWIIKIEDVTQKKLYKKFSELVKNRNKYLNILRVTLPSYIKKAEENKVYIKRAYEMSLK